MLHIPFEEGLYYHKRWSHLNPGISTTPQGVSNYYPIPDNPVIRVYLLPFFTYNN
jgi:hypothetical protein